MLVIEKEDLSSHIPGFYQSYFSICFNIFSQLVTVTMKQLSNNLFHRKYIPPFNCLTFITHVNVVSILSQNQTYK